MGKVLRKILLTFTLLFLYLRAVIYGIGVDIIEVERIKKAISCFGERFLGRVFTEEEVATCQKKANKYQSLAARFCAKEAVIKAFGLSGLSLNEIGVVNNKNKVPEIRLKGKSQENFERLSLGPIHLSLSHIKDYALAQVVIEDSGCQVQSSRFTAKK